MAKTTLVGEGVESRVLLKGLPPVSESARDCVRTPLDGGGEAKEGGAVVERETGVDHIGRPHPRQAHQRRHGP